MAGMDTDLPTVDVSEIDALRQAGATLLDVREDDEWAAGRIDGALHIPMNQLPSRLPASELDQHTPVVVVCKVGSRSAHVTAWLNQQGYDARNLEGGMLAWAVAHKPMTAAAGVSPSVY